MGKIDRLNLLSLTTCLAASLLLQACSDSNDSFVANVKPHIDVQAELDACVSKQLTAVSQVLASGWTLNNQSTRHVDASVAFLTRDDIAGLELLWSYAFPGEQERRGHPAVTSEAVILGSFSGEVRALGRSTGCAIWQFNADAQVRSAILLGDDPDGIGRLAYFGDTEATVYALDAETGELRWKVRIDEHPDAVITGSPQLVDSQLIVPVSSLEVRTAALPTYPCCSFRGAVVSLAAADGAEQWRYQTIRDQPVLNPATGFTGPSGAPVWATPTVDRERRLVFIGTGENYSEPATDTSDAIIALDLDTGETRWRMQSTVEDTWNIACLLPPPLNRNCPSVAGPDLDFGAAPVLVEREGREDILIAAQKSGDVYALSPADGSVLWHRALGSGGNLGGAHWGVATDDSRVYVPISDIQSRELDFNDLADLDNAATIFQPEGAEPGLYALDLDTGVTQWFTQPSRITPLGEQRPAILSAAITLANGLVYAGGLDGFLRVFDAETGAELWSVNTALSVIGVNGVEGNGGTIDSGGPVVAGDLLYINSGYVIFGQDPTWFAGPGNLFMAYGRAASP